MKIQTELEQKPHNRTTSLWKDYGIEDCIRIRCRGSVRLPGGTMVSIKSREHIGIPKNMRERIEAAYQRLRENVLNDLRFSTRNNKGVELDEKNTAPDGELDSVRKTLVMQSHGQAAEVFAFIDRLAEEHSGITWAKHPGLGIRGSVTGTPPRIFQETQGASFELSQPEWDSDGELDCLCVLAMNRAVNDTDKEDDLKRDIVHHEPMVEARRLAANAEDEKDTPTAFTMDTSPWGLLVAASDNANIAEWINDYHGKATKEEVEQLTTTYWSIKSWLQLKLAPVFAETIYVDSPGDIPCPEPENTTEA